MNQYLVTVKVAKTADHDPHNKVIAPCPASPDKVCSDATGEHHTILWNDISMVAAYNYWRHLRNMHVTRVEEV